MSMAADNEGRVTIVMTARERHSLAEAAIDSVIAGTPRPFRFIYIDVQSPDWLRDSLGRRASSGELEVVRFDEPLWPQEARIRVADAIRTEYVVFMDNDVQVEEGWVDALVACADATGAGIVGPLYLLGDGVQAPKIHMLGGKLTESAEAGGRILEEAHVLANEDPRRHAASLLRQPCDFVEYHCMLVRTKLLRARGLDPSIFSVHEHIDASLSARQLGFATFVEPASRVTYLGLAEVMLDELPLFRRRWSAAEAEASIEAFCRKWNVINDDRSFGGARHFWRDHVANVDPIRATLSGAVEHTHAMRPDELKQTRSDVLDLAAARGYAHDELAMIANAYHVAHVLADGGYRPCGRPFINHLAGTASVLIRYGFQARTVAAGLLHSAYSHCPPHQGGVNAAIDAVCAALGGKDGALDRRVRAYTLRESDPATEAFAALSVLDAEIIAIVAANELDMHFSGEFRYSGRTDAIGEPMHALIDQVCDVLGVGGLGKALRQVERAQTTATRPFLSTVQYSYRIGSDRRSALPMASPPAMAIALRG